MRFGRCSYALIALTLTIAGCEGRIAAAIENEPSAHYGRVGLSLRIGQIDVSEVRFTITRVDGFRRQGAIPLTLQDASFSAVFVLPEANDYRVVLEALTDDGDVCTGASDFNVRSNRNTSVGVRLRCPAHQDLGNVTLEGQINACPVIDSLVAMPQRAALGNPVALSAIASDADALSYRWVASSGTLQANGDHATFECSEAGRVIVNLLAYDGDQECLDASTAAIAIECYDLNADLGEPNAGSSAPSLDAGTDLDIDSGT